MPNSAAWQVRIVALAMWLLITGYVHVLGQTPFEATAEKKDRIDAWIRELDAPEFLARETAMLQLIGAGQAVLPALAPVLTGGSLEATSRALFIVRQLGLAADIDTQDQSGQLLAKLAERKEAPALARRAAATLAELTQQRSEQSLTELERQGVKVSRTNNDRIFLNEPVLSIEVGDGFRGEDAELRRLKWIADVPVVILSGKRATNDWIKHAATMPGMQELHLYQANLGESALAPLADHPNLRQVGIYYTPVRETCLPPLTKLPLLAFVKFYGTQITQEAVEKLKGESGLAIDFRRGAFLGVQGSDMGAGCRVSKAHPGSPAEKGGLLPDDMIVRFGGAAVASFGGLTDLISTREVGEQVEIEVARRVFDEPGSGVRIVKTTVTLAAWELETAVQNIRR